MHRPLMLTALVVAGLLGLGFAPSFEAFGLNVGRVDILSSLRPEIVVETPVDYEADMTKLEEEISEVEEVVDSLPETPPVTYTIVSGEPMAMPRAALTSSSLLPDTTKAIVAIEDFDTAEVSALDRFVQKLVDGDDVRIAFLGDSFVEGDIVTVDMRDQLQRVYGGRGVGFVPCDIPYAIARNSVKRIATGWVSYSVMNPKKAPVGVRDNFYVSGFVAKGGAGARANWQSVNSFPTIDSCNVARVFFASPGDSRVEVVVNDTMRQQFDVEGADKLRQIYIESPVKSLSFKVLNGNVMCYGASLESGEGGVTVDNFSIRSNSGNAIFGTSAVVNRQFDQLLDYDLVVLQYGLNIMTASQRDYSKYRAKVCDMIEYAKRCFPNAAILVLGVSDRWVRSNGCYVPMSSVAALTSYQRSAAERSGVAFWNTSKAMEEHGGMKGFVSKGWAARDYTHINFAGGKRIATALVRAINLRAYDELVKRENEEAAETEQVPVAAEPVAVEPAAVQPVTPVKVVVEVPVANDSVAKTTVVEHEAADSVLNEQSVVKIDTAKLDDVNVDSLAVKSDSVVTEVVKENIVLQ